MARKQGTYGTPEFPVILDNEISFMISRYSPKPPEDKNGIPIMIDDLIHLEHNNETSRVRTMHYVGDGIWHVFLDANEEGFSLPAQKDNITHVIGGATCIEKKNQE